MVLVMRWVRFGVSAAFILVSTFSVAGTDYQDFSDTSGLTINGNAATTTTGDGVVLRLTPSLQWQAGSAFTTESVLLGPFSSSFVFRFGSPSPWSGGCNSTGGADGITFAIQSLADTAIGAAGSDLGIAGIAPSFAVEFDSWCNTSSDPDKSHVGIDLDGSVDSVATASISPDLNDGSDLWYVWIDYDGLAVEVRTSTSSSRPTDPLLSYAIDLLSEVGQEAYVGFTGATGDVFQTQDILLWQFDVSIDADGDGTPDILDNCPEDFNEDQADLDADGVGDVCDNCPFPNPGQEDLDENDIGDACDQLFALLGTSDQLAALLAALDALTARVDDLEASDAAQAGELASLQAQITALQAQIDALQITIDQIENLPTIQRLLDKVQELEEAAP